MRLCWRLATIVVLATASPALAQDGESLKWGSFSRASFFGPGRDVDVEIDEVFGLEPHWLAKRSFRAGVDKGARSEADSRTCPALVASLNALKGLEKDLGAFQVVVPELPGKSAIAPPPMLDGGSYSLSVSGQFPGEKTNERYWTSIQITAGNSPLLARWVDSTLVSLDRCWVPK